MRTVRTSLIAAALWLGAVAGAFGQAPTFNSTGLVVATCGTVPTAFVATRAGPFTVDVNGNLCIVLSAGGSTVGTNELPTASATYGIAPIVSASAENNHVFKASAGNVYSVTAVNLTATAGFLVLLDATSAPVDGAITPKACAPLPANTAGGAASIKYDLGALGAYATGITAVVTSAATCFTKTTGVITAFLSGQVK